MFLWAVCGKDFKEFEHFLSESIVEVWLTLVALVRRHAECGLPVSERAWKVVAGLCAEVSAGNGPSMFPHDGCPSAPEQECDSPFAGVVFLFHSIHTSLS